MKSNRLTGGLYKPHPSEYKEVPFTLPQMLGKFFIFYFFIFFPVLAFHQETFRAGAIINLMIRKHIYGQGNLHDYLALDPLDQPYDKEIPECDIDMSPREFYQDYVRKGRPCLFKGYGKRQIAYQRWRNETYMRETAGDDIIFAER